MIQKFEYKDLKALATLQPADWNEIETIHRYYLSRAHCATFKFVQRGDIVAIGTCIQHQEVAWLAHIVVHLKHRNKGLGKTMTAHLMQYAERLKCKTIYLIATELGQPVYAKLGFECEMNYLMYKDVQLETQPDVTFCTTEISKADVEALIEMDFNISGEQRQIDLSQNMQNMVAFKKDNKPLGFYLPAFGEGLIIAENELVGLELLKLRNQDKTFAAFPEGNVAATDFMNAQNIVVHRSMQRMRFGDKRVWKPENIFNRVGGNLG